MNENYSLEELEAYLYGDLPEERNNQLKESIKTDLALQEELAALQISREAVELVGWKSVIAQSQKEFLAEREGTKIKPIRSGQSGNGLWLGRIAASLSFVLVGSLAVLFFTTSPESITKNQIDYSLPVLRSSAEQLEALEQAYQKQEFDQVLELAEGINSYDAKTYLLIGLANLELNNGLEAEEYLTQIESENQSTSTLNYSDEVDYYLIKAHLIQGEIPEAEKRIIKITEDSNHTYHNNFGLLDLIKLKILKFKN